MSFWSLAIRHRLLRWLARALIATVVATPGAGSLWFGYAHEAEDLPPVARLGAWGRCHWRERRWLVERRRRRVKGKPMSMVAPGGARVIRLLGLAMVGNDALSGFQALG